MPDEPRGDRPPFVGGPMGGPGGPMGGPGGLMGGRSMTEARYRWRSVPDYVGAYERNRANGYVGSSTYDSWAERNAKNSVIYATQRVRFQSQYKGKTFGKLRGSIKGTIVAFKGIHLGGMRKMTANSRIAAARDEFEKGYLGQKGLNKRIIRANKEYYSYLYNIGYLTESEYRYKMEGVLEGLNMEVGRTR